jgi:hypothetical protein
MSGQGHHSLTIPQSTAGYRADAWDDAGKRNYDAAGYAWAWEPELRHQLLSLRRAANSEGLAKLFGSFSGARSSATSHLLS